ncbi:alpha/beta fold hydrolase [Catellatospora sp. NPDC049111]|uniref:alpha/beta fold hydrolase n=1 Tax=Catellatospora sp. NPDC049111 TaxID=3155271 RepID=UPI0033E530BB
MALDRPEFHVDASGAQGAQAGNNSTQYNTFYSPAPHVVWPVRSGVVSPLADCLQSRHAEQEALAGGSGATTVLVQVLAGMGGVGKTQLAAGHAERLWADRLLDLLVWVPAGARVSVVDGYADAARQLGVDGGLAGEQAAARLLGWLAGTSSRWLVVLDDLTDPDDLRGLWPPRNLTGSVVVTTRSRDAALAGAGRRLVDVGLFTKQQAHDYLTARLAGHPALADDISGLAADLGYLPLALAQAAVYMVNQQRACSWYRAAFADRSKHLKQLAPHRLPDQHSDTVAATWSLSIEQADKLEPQGLARHVLRLACLLDPNGIPASVLAATPVLTWLGTTAGRQVTPDDVHDAVRNLHLHSLATHDPNNPARSLRVHALIQRAAYDQTSQNARDSATIAAADALQAVWPGIETDPDLGQALRANTEHLHHTNPDPLWTTDDGGHRVLFTAGTSLGEAGQVQAAAGYYQRLHHTAHQRLGPDHPNTLTARQNLASWRGRAGDAAGAAAAFEQLLADVLRILGPDHPDTLATRGNLASWRGEVGDAAGAAAAFEQLLADVLRILGPDHPDTLATRSNLASWRGEIGDAAGAADTFEQLLADRLRVHGPDHPDTLATRHNVARWRGEADDAAGAAAATEQLLADVLRILGPDHPDTLATRSNFAYWRGQAGDPAGAVAATEQLLADLLRVHGPDHPHTLATRGNLASWRGQAGDPAGAVAATEQLLADRLRVHGPDHPNTLNTRGHLARWQGEVGDAAGAAAAFEQLLADRLRVHGPDHPDTLTTRGNLASWRGQRRPVTQPVPPPRSSSSWPTDCESTAPTTPTPWPPAAASTTGGGRLRWRDTARSDPLALLEGIRAAVGVPTWIVVGHSWGCDLAVRYAVEHSRAVAAVVSIAGRSPQRDRTWSQAYEAGKATEPGVDIGWVPE